MKQPHFRGNHPMPSDHKPHSTYWNLGIRPVAKSMSGFFTVAMGGYWLLHTGGRLWSELSEAGTLTLFDSTTAAPLTTNPFPVTEPFTGWGVSSEGTSTEFAVHTSFSDPDTEAEDGFSKQGVKTELMHPGKRRLLSNTNAMKSNFTRFQFPAVIQLSSLNGQNGFKLDGENNGDQSGYSVNAAGDINGDGYNDVLIGAPNSGGKGRSYVVFGDPGVGKTGTLLLSSLNGSNGFKLDGENNNDQSGYSVNAAGDINGDGYNDVLIGAPNSGGKGRSYVVFGDPGVGKTGTLLLSSLNGSNGFKLDGENNNDQSGYSVSAAGDINGDGYNDALIGAPGYGNSGNPNRDGPWGIGRSYVVFGGPGVGVNGTLLLSSLNGSNGFKLDGENNNDQSGYSVSAAGDINGDGYNDVLIGAPGYGNPGNPNRDGPWWWWGIGRSYMVFGGPGVRVNGTLLLSSLNGNNGFKLDGENNGDQSGYSVSAAGDINGDDYADVVIATYRNFSGSYIGLSYMVFGGPEVGGKNGTLLLSSLNGSNGFNLYGENNYPWSGTPSISAAGDINGDGYADVVIGAAGYYSSDSYKGRSYVVFGGPGVGNSGILLLSSLNGSNGFKLDGENNNDQSGYSVSAAGDINGDGYNDVLIGAPGYPSGSDEGRNYNKGRSYVIFSNGTFPYPSSPNSNIVLISGIVAVAGASLFLLSCSLYKYFKKKSDKVLSPDKKGELRNSIRTSVVLKSVNQESDRAYHSLEDSQSIPLSQPVGPLLRTIRPQNQSLEYKQSGRDSQSRSLGEISPASPQLINEVGEMKISLSISYQELEFNEEDKLGSGAYGTVYKGIYKFNEVAIKQLNSQNLSEVALNELKLEAGILGSMRSDYIVQLRGICLETPHYCLVMELMPKGSLYNVLQNSPGELPLSVRYRISLDVCYGLYHLHEKNILHRDLKSLNVLLDDRLRAKITDFGLSKVKSEVASSSSTQGMKGTLGWMAPELFEEKPQAGAAADIYAFGMVLWEMMVNPYRIPFQGLAPASLISAKLTRGNKQETIPESCPPMIAQLMRACWQEQSMRPSAKILAKSLNAFFKASQEKPLINNEVKMNDNNVKKLSNNQFTLHGSTPPIEQSSLITASPPNNPSNIMNDSSLITAFV